MKNALPSLCLAQVRPNASTHSYTLGDSEAVVDLAVLKGTAIPIVGLFTYGRLISPTAESSSLSASEAPTWGKGAEWVSSRRKGYPTHTQVPSVGSLRSPYALIVNIFCVDGGIAADRCRVTRVLGGPSIIRL